MTINCMAAMLQKAGVKMIKGMKMSKYNFVTYDNDGNLIVYNFLSGLTSLTKIMKNDVEKFMQIFIENKEILEESCNKYTEATDILCKNGILVDADIDENILYDAKVFEEIYNNRLTLTIFPTGRCNFRCPYCFEIPQHFNRGDMTKEAQNALIKFVQKEITNHKELRVSWFGGEPLVTPEVIKYLSDKFIKICNMRHIPYYAEMTTNGYLLDADMFDMLYKLKVYQYMITIDGFKELHDKQRITLDGKGSYDVIINNLLRIRDSKQYKFAHIRIRINMSNSFLEILDDFIYYLESLFSDDSRFEFMFVPVANFFDANYYGGDFRNEQSTFFKRLNDNDMYRNKLCHESLLLNLIVRQPSCCAATKNSYVITSDLNVHKCNAHYDFDVNKLGHISLNGNLLIDEIIHKRWYLTKRIIKKSSELCDECFYKPCCVKYEPGCPTSYLRATPDEISCPIKGNVQEKDIIDAILYAASKHPYEIITL